MEDSTVAQGCGLNRLRTIAGAFGIAAALAACGGGGGGSIPSTGGGSTPTLSPSPTSSATQSASTTNASGTVVDDGTGTALAGVSVKLMPWAPCGATPAPTSITPENDGCPTPLPSPQATTNAQGQFTLNGAPNGHYLLVIGADAVATVPPGYTTPPSTCGGGPCATPSPARGTPVQATVHDNVTLSGGNVTLKAPTLPSVASGYTAPSWETNGDYRLATLNAQTEMPCLIAWQYDRTQSSVAGASVDEWVIENVRAANAYQQVAAAGSPIQLLSTGNAGANGGTYCGASLVDSTLFSQTSYVKDPRTLWFGGQYVYYSAYGGTDNEASGIAEFPIDPRSFTDPNHPTWP